GHEAGLLQHAQVLRDGGAADGQLARDLADRAGALAELLEDRPAGRVAQRIHGVSVSHDLRKSTLTAAELSSQAQRMCTRTTSVPPALGTQMSPNGAKGRLFSDINSKKSEARAAHPRTCARRPRQLRALP